jgi:hypothetical protein
VQTVAKHFAMDAQARTIAPDAIQTIVLDTIDWLIVVLVRCNTVESTVVTRTVGCVPRLVIFLVVARTVFHL